MSRIDWDTFACIKDIGCEQGKLHRETVQWVKLLTEQLSLIARVVDAAYTKHEGTGDEGLAQTQT